MSEFSKDLMESMQQALDYSKGKTAGVRVHKIDTVKVDATAVRKKLGITQQDMAYILGVSLSGYRKWEQGARQPSGAARTLLLVMDREPEAVLKALR